MLLGKISIRDTHLVLEDIDKKSEASMPLEDALELLDWLQKHRTEIEQRISDLAKRSDS